ncbi:MAG: DNA starvation/stationary phase protection protein [Candidatus Gracilibacteria bacterium]|nr:DNA starvation/stationary phase protection protein [Candidatus Gracilibacteria bacterium]
MAHTNIIGDMGKLLASTYTLYLKTQNFHWNVTGPFFQTLHLMFEEQYTALALANDGIAERIRALGAPAPATYAEYSQLSIITEPQGKQSAERMVEMLLQDHEKIISFTKKLLIKATDQGDEGTADILTTRISDQEKTAWMLRSFLDKG